MSIGENYEGNITPIGSERSTFSRGTETTFEHIVKIFGNAEINQTADVSAKTQNSCTSSVGPAINLKILRLYAQTAEFESGRVLLPRSAPWRDAYVHELTTFPGSKYDDQVDSTTQALDHLKTHRSLLVWEKLGVD